MWSYRGFYWANGGSIYYGPITGVDLRLIKELDWGDCTLVARYQEEGRFRQAQIRKYYSGVQSVELYFVGLEY